MSHSSFTTQLHRLSLLALALPAIGAAAQPAANAGCTVVAGAPRNQSPSDSQTNDRWNRLNFSFFDAVASAVASNDKVVQAFFPVESSDAARNTDSVLAEAAKAGCTKLVLVSVFSDQGKGEPELVFALRASPIQRQPSAAQPGTDLSLGTPEYEKEYRFPATASSFARVVPSRIAEQAVQDYLRSGKR